MVYDKLHQLARQHMQGEGRGHTLQATALLHEAYLRLLGGVAPGWKDSGHFFSVAATAMRHVLVDPARARRSMARGGAAERMPLEEALAICEADGLDVVAVHEALQQLEALDPELARIVEMHFFGGLTIAEIAKHLGCTERTVYARWSLARAWLRGRLKP
jgi:RNA polymerase sigma factor (TIGR02999 family)